MELLFRPVAPPVVLVCKRAADTVYISFGKPKPALGVDVGEGVIVRYDEKAREVVGLTLIGVGKRMEEYMRKNSLRNE